MLMTVSFLAWTTRFFATGPVVESVGGEAGGCVCEVCWVL